MTAYWDQIMQRVREARTLPNDDAFLEAVIAIEAEVCRAVETTTSDHEFPEDLRGRLQRVTATNVIDVGRFVADTFEDGEPFASTTINKRARNWLLTMRYSILIEELHSSFHYVATRRAPNRYDGFFTDDPSSFVRARERALTKEP